MVRAHRGCAGRLGQREKQKHLEMLGREGAAEGREGRDGTGGRNTTELMHAMRTESAPHGKIGVQRTQSVEPRGTRGLRYKRRACLTQVPRRKIGV